MSKFDFTNMTLESAEEECANLVGTQFGHNMIGLILRKVEEKFGENTFFQHIGIYAFRADILSEITDLKESKNEIKENLEQLRWMDNKYKIKVGITEKESISVDKEEDIEKIESLHIKNS